jgi:hypothetical protein
LDIRSDDDRNDSDNSDESVEDLVSGSFDNIADNAGNGDEEGIDRGGEHATITGIGR